VPSVVKLQVGVGDVLRYKVLVVVTCSTVGT
jgi:hypothetical protein